jgi:hypothetical protein
MDDQVLAATTLLAEAKSAIQADKRTEAATKLSQAYAIAQEFQMETVTGDLQVVTP